MDKQPKWIDEMIKSALNAHIKGDKFFTAKILLGSLVIPPDEIKYYTYKRKKTKQ